MIFQGFSTVWGCFPKEKRTPAVMPHGAGSGDKKMAMLHDARLCLLSPPGRPPPWGSGHSSPCISPATRAGCPALPSAGAAPAPLRFPRSRRSSPSPSSFLFHPMRRAERPFRRHTKLVYSNLNNSIHSFASFVNIPIEKTPPQNAEAHVVICRNPYFRSLISLHSLAAKSSRLYTAVWSVSRSRTEILPSAISFSPMMIM